MSRKPFAVVVCVAALTVATAGTGSAADAIVGTGTAGSCSEAALNAAVATVLPAGGTITFNCGGAATIDLTTEKRFFYAPNPNLTYTIDGGGVITLNAGGRTRHIFHLSGVLNISNITLTGGRASGAADAASGGAIRSDRDVQHVPSPTMALNLNNVTFTSNVSALTSPTTPPFYPFDYGGGAVFTRLAFLNIANCTFVGNTASNDAGGAVHGRSSTISITSSAFTSNSSTGGGFGGAIHVDGASPTGSNGQVVITASTFSGNSALSQGGAIYFYLYPEKNETFTLDTVNVVGNQVVDSGVIDFVGTRGFGGGLAGDQGHVVIRNSTFANNVARGQVSTNGGGAGGGISLIQNGSVTITNTTISGNRARGGDSNASGGGLVIYGNAQPFQLVHSTIVANQADFTGGGIQSSANGVLTNTMVASNTALAFGGSIMQQCSAELVNGGGALQYPDISGTPHASNPRCAANVIVSNPLLGALANNGGFAQTHEPQIGSPVIDAATCPTAIDQRGVARPQGSACEIGAVERLGGPATALGVDGPAVGSVVATPFTVFGWALDPGVGSGNGTGIDLVAVFTGSTCGGTLLGNGETNLARPDVRAYFGLDASYTNSGYAITLSPAPGPLTFTVCARSTITSTYTARTTRSVTVAFPRMNVDTPGGSVPQTFTLAGWAFDGAAATGPGVNLVRVFLGASCSGTVLADATLGLARPDVRTAFGLPSSFGNTGFSATVTLPAATSQQVTTCARSTVTQSFAVQITRTFQVSDARVHIDTPLESAGTVAPVLVAGWAFDRGTASGPGVDLVRVFAGGSCAGTVLADATLGIARPDVRSAFGLPASFSNTGFSASVTPPGIGVQLITVCARSTLTGQFAAQASRTVRISNTLMNIDTPVPGATVSTTFTIAGWAFDNGAGSAGPGIDQWRLFIGTACSGSQLPGSATLGITRPDVQAAFGLPGGYIATGYSATVSAAPGSLTFTACVRSTVTGTFTRAITRKVTVN